MADLGRWIMMNTSMRTLLNYTVIVWINNLQVLACRELILGDYNNGHALTHVLRHNLYIEYSLGVRCTQMTGWKLLKLMACCGVMLRNLRTRRAKPMTGVAPDQKTWSANDYIPFLEQFCDWYGIVLPASCCLNHESMVAFGLWLDESR